MDNDRKIEKLAKPLKQTSESLNANAAVVVLLRVAGQDFHVLLVKRAENPTDKWSGQTALPGGKRDPEDIDIKATVVRETLEETSINLLDDCRFVGTMEPLSSVEKPEIKILPFIVMQEKEQVIKLNQELTEYFWAPLKELDSHKGTAKLKLGEFPAYKIDKHVIWGLTYNILHNLLSLLSDIEKEELKEN